MAGRQTLKKTLWFVAGIALAVITLVAVFFIAVNIIIAISLPSMGMMSPAEQWRDIRKHEGVTITDTYGHAWQGHEEACVLHYADDAALEFVIAQYKLKPAEEGDDVRPMLDASDYPWWFMQPPVEVYFHSHDDGRWTDCRVLWVDREQRVAYLQLTYR